MRIKTGLVGYGLGGRCFHAPFIASTPGYELATVVERKSETARERYADVKIARSLEELLSEDSIRLVVITTPNETHYPFAKLCLEKGKDVVVDKPMTLSSAQAADLIELAKQKNRLLSVYQNRRYASDARTIQKILKEELLGPVHEFEAQYNRYRPLLRVHWKESDVPGSGILYDLGPHLIDQALSLFGIPQTITAAIRKQRPGAVADDYFDIRLDYEKTRVILKAGMMVREQGPRYQIHGMNGSFIKYGDDPQDMDLRAGKDPSSPEWGIEPESQDGLLHTETGGEEVYKKLPTEKGDFGIFYRDLYKTLTSGAPLKVLPEQGFNVVKMIELARESDRLKRTLKCTGLFDVPYDLS